MLQFILFVLDVVRVLVTVFLLIALVLVGAWAVLWSIKQIVSYIRWCRREARRRKTRKQIEKIFTDARRPFEKPRAETQHPLIQADFVLTNARRRDKKDNETIHKATEYRNGING